MQSRFNPLFDRRQSALLGWRCPIIYGRRAPREEHGIWDDSACSKRVECKGLTAGLLDVISSFRRVIVARNPRNIEHFHGPVKHTMYNLKSGRLVAPDSRSVSDVASLPLPFGIFDRDVAGLEYLDGKWVRAVLSNGLEEPWNERGTHDLEFECFRIRNLDSCLAVVYMVEELEILFMGTLGTVNIICRLSHDERTRISGKTSTHPAKAHSLRRTSLN